MGTDLWSDCPQDNFRIGVALARIALQISSLVDFTRVFCQWAFFSIGHIFRSVAEKGRKKQKISRLGAAPIGKSVTWRRLSKLLTFLGSPPKRDEAKSKVYIRGGEVVKQVLDTSLMRP